MCRATLHCTAILVLGGLPAAAIAQQVQVETPLIGVNDRFFEQFNVGWGFRHVTPQSAFFFRFGGPAVPPFGGFNPNVGSNLGVASQWGNGDFFFNFSAAQGYQSSMTMAAPSVTVMNGVPGFIQDATFRPFVTGLIPVVGYPVYPIGAVYPVGPMYPMTTAAPGFQSPLVERLARLRNEPPRPNAEGGAPQPAADNPEAAPAVAVRRDSTAQRGDVSVAEIRRQQAAEDAEREAELERIIAEGKTAQEAGQLGIARVRYRQAAARVTGERRQELLRAAERLK